MMPSAQHIGELVRLAREAKNLEQDFCADEVGLSFMEYYDLEAYDGEFFDNISLGTARRICRLLELDILELTATHLTVAIAERTPMPNLGFYARDTLISEARRRLNLTERDLGDAIGFEAIVVHLLERTPDYIETLPINVVVDIAKTLALDPGALICNRDGAP